MAQELYLDIIEKLNDLPPGLLPAVMHQESRGNPNAVSPKGAQGIFQFMPPTARQYGIDPLDPQQSASAAGRMYGDLSRQYKGNLPMMLAGYNWGSGNVQRQGMEKAPKETRDYIANITAAMNKGKPQQPETRAEAKAPEADFTDIEAALRDPKSPQPQDYADIEAVLRGKTEPEKTTGEKVDAAIRSGVKGFVSGLGDIGNTIINFGTKNNAPLKGQVDAIVNGVVPKEAAVPVSTEADILRANEERQAGLEDFNTENASPAFTVGRMGGNIAATWPVGGAVGAGIKGLGTLPGLTRAAPMFSAVGEATTTGGISAGAVKGTAARAAARATGGAINGGTSAALINPDDAATGAAIGAAAGPVLGGMARVIRPNTSKEVRTLIDAGVTPTTGQLFGKMGQLIENIVADKVPVLGGMVVNSQKRAVNELGVAAVNKVLKPLDIVVEKGLPTVKAIEAAGAKLDETFSRITLGISVKTNDLGMRSTIKNAVNGFVGKDSDHATKVFTSALGDAGLGAFMPRTKGVTMDGFNLMAARKKLDEEIAFMSRHHGKGKILWGNSQNPKLIENLVAVRDKLDDLIQRSAGENAPKLNAIKTARSHLRLLKGNEGPGQLQKLVGSVDPDLMRAGASVLGQNMPTGKGFELTTPVLGASLLGMLTDPTQLTTSALLGGAGQSILYSGTGQRLAASLLTARPDIAVPLAQGVRGLAPHIGATVPAFMDDR